MANAAVSAERKAHPIGLIWCCLVRCWLAGTGASCTATACTTQAPTSRSKESSITGSSGQAKARTTRRRSRPGSARSREPRSSLSRSLARSRACVRSPRVLALVAHLAHVSRWEERNWLPIHHPLIVRCSTLAACFSLADLPPPSLRTASRPGPCGHPTSEHPIPAHCSNCHQLAQCLTLPYCSPHARTRAVHRARH